MATRAGELEIELANIRDEEVSHEEHMRGLEKEVFRLTCFYFLFQGLILTAFYKAPTHVKCHYKWIPMSLSGLAGTLNFTVLVISVFRYNKDSKTSVMVIMRFLRCLYVYMCVVSVLAFLLFALASFWVVTCNPAGHN